MHPDPKKSSLRDSGIPVGIVGNFGIHLRAGIFFWTPGKQIPMFPIWRCTLIPKNLLCVIQAFPWELWKPLGSISVLEFLSGHLELTKSWILNISQYLNIPTSWNYFSLFHLSFEGMLEFLKVFHEIFGMSERTDPSGNKPTDF